MKKELKEKRFRVKIDKIRTKRKRILENSTMNNRKDTIIGLKRLVKELKTFKGSWILDGYTKDILDRFIETLNEDLVSS